MTSQSRLLLLLLFGGLVFLGVGSVAAFFGFQEYRRSEWREAAYASFENEDWPAASTALSRYLPHDPSNTELLTMYAEANSHILDDRPVALRNVAHAYHQILRYEPGNTRAQEQLLKLYERQGAWDVLEYYAADWLRRKPESEVLLRARALALDKSGSLDDALAAYEDLFARHRADSMELSRYAGLIRERSTSAEAEQFLVGILEERPSDPDVIVATAQYWLDVGDLETAKHFVARAAEAAPDFRAYRVLHARIAASEREWEKALALSDMRLNDGTLDAELVSLRANVYLASGDAESASALLADTPQEVRIDHPRLQILLIDSLYGLSRIADAREASSLYLRAYPLDIATLNYADGRDALADGRYVDAASALAIAVELRLDFRAARLALAVAEIESGDVAAGRGVLEAYLRENPGDNRARSLWANHFGLSIEDADRLARQSLDEESGNADALMAAAELMTNAAAREGSLAERAQAIAELAQRAAEVTPTSPAPYRLMTGLWLRLGDTARAREVFANAKEAGVDAGVIQDISGTIALAEGNVEDAWTTFTTAAARLDDDELRRWARRFARAGAYAEAQRVFEVGESGHSNGRFSMDRAELAAEFGPLEEAWIAFEAIESDRQPLNRLRLLLAIRYSESTDEQRVARLHQLAMGSGESDDDALALVVRALNAQHGENSDAKKAETLLLIAEQLAPNNAMVLDRLRAFFEQTSQPDTALDYAERVCAAEPGDDRFRFELGRLQAANGLYREAERTMRGVLNRQPNNQRARSILVRALLDSGQIETAEVELSNLSDTNADDAGRLRSRVLMARSSHAEAETLLRKRVAESPDDRTALWDLAVCVRELGRGDEGSALLRQATAGKDATAQDWALLARYYLADDAFDSAARAALRALLLDPNHADSLRMLAQIRERENDAASALAILRRYTDARPDDAAAWHRRAQLELATGGRWSDALASVDRAFMISPDATYRALRGFVHAGLKNYSEAIDDLEEAGADLPATSVQFELALAECYLYTDSLEQAEHRLAVAERKLERAGVADSAKLAELKASLASRKDAE